MINSYSLVQAPASILSSWISTVVIESDITTSAHIYECLSGLIYGGVIIPKSGDEVSAVKLFKTASPVTLIEYIYNIQQVNKKVKDCPKISSAQKAIILESQVEVDVSFTHVLYLLTGWQADVIIKGLVIASELQRQTGSKYITSTCIRLSIKDYVGNYLPSASYYRQIVDVPHTAHANKEQLRSIYLLQSELDVDFDLLIGRIDSKCADIIIKGLVCVSELKRVTGYRKMTLGNLRKAIRSFVDQSVLKGNEHEHA